MLLYLRRQLLAVLFALVNLVSSSQKEQRDPLHLLCAAEGGVEKERLKINVPWCKGYVAMYQQKRRAAGPYSVVRGSFT